MFRLRKSVIYAAAFIAAAAAITFGVIFVAKLNKELISEIPSPYYHDKTFRLNNWQYRWGDSPVEADGRFLWMDKSYDDGGWTDYEFPGRPANSGRYRSIWIKAVLPVLDMDHATFGLRVTQNTVEVYLEDRLIYSYGTHSISETVRTPGSIWHFIDLPDDFAGKTVYIRASSPFPHMTGYLTQAFVGHRAAIYIDIFKMNISTLLIGSLCIFLGLAIIMIQVLSLYRRNSDIYLGLGSVFIGGWLLMECNLIQLFTPAPVSMTYAANFFVYLAPVFLLLFVERNYIVENTSYARLMRIQAMLHAIFAVAAFALDFLGLVSVLYSVRVFTFMFAATVLIGVYATVRSIIAGKKSARILIIGILALGISGLMDTFLFFYNTSQQQKDNIVSEAGMLVFLTVLMINAALELKQLYKQIEQQSKETETNYKSLFTNMTDGFTLNRLEYDDDGHLKHCIICEVNDAFSEQFGLGRDELVGSDLLELLPEIADICPERYDYLDAAEETAAVREAHITDEAVRLRGKWYKLSIFFPQKDHMSIIFSDVTAMKKAEETIRRQAYTDSMTGFCNRLFFESEMLRMNADLDTLKPLSIVVIDIDGLKITNDTFGHNAGDELLKKAASIIRKVFRNCGSISRIGGDEFCVLLPNTDLKTAQEKIEHLLKLQNRLNNIYSDIPIGMSIGLASTEESEKEEDIYSVYRRADDDMYRYKIGQTSSAKSRVVDMLLAALAEKDFVAQGHVERISGLCMQMADALDLNEGQKRNLLLLSKIHDLGKIGVPDDILNKPGKLTKKEFEKMKTHVNIGFNIASRAKELVSVAPFILHHHEHWNGTGYPDGLKGEEIPLECRILSIIDAYDAMTNDRPYHKGISVDEALEEIQKCAGKQFDPFLVEKFIEIIKGAGKDAGGEADGTDTADSGVDPYDLDETGITYTIFNSMIDAKADSMANGFAGNMACGMADSITGSPIECNDDGTNADAGKTDGDLAGEYYAAVGNSTVG